jgi:RNA polymerase sigma-70 factor (ECF subfamily)
MASPATPGQRPALTAAQAVALALLKHGHTQRTIQARTGVTPDALYRLAAAWDITAPCGTVEGHACHTARDEDPCVPCTTARGRADARERARQRKTLPAAVLRARLGTSRRRKAVTR